MIFTLPQSYLDDNPTAPKGHLIFLDWFSKPRNSADEASKLYEVQKQRERGNAELVGEVIPLSSVRQSVQLIPKFGRQNVDKTWTSETVLDVCESFYINNWGSVHTYQAIY